MPKQIGLIKIKGKLGDTSFYKSKDGYLVRDKGGVDGQRIKSDPRFQRTRENMAEFGQSAKMGAELRKLLAPVIQKIKDPRMANRLTAKVREAINADVSHPRGERLLQDGDLSLLQDFDFNVLSPFSTTYFGSHARSIDRATGDVDVTVPVFDPEDYLQAPTESTHFRFVVGILEWDISGAASKLVVERSSYLPKNAATTADIVLSGSITANTTKPILVVLGVEFAQQLNSVNYALADSGFMAARVVAVEV
ncbi:MAG: hypothetical protein EP332_12715 [Bacteroidetes bacterium]|nr:MAG: hypothetical protein EP332_12715 [Bacteroidota bacterium]